MMGRTAKQQAEDFMQANDKSPAVSAYLIEPNPNRSRKGIVYRLKDGSSHRLNDTAANLVTAPFPIWDFE